jgi:hypothetical protein
MPEVPKIVYHRLRAGAATQGAEAHPEADVLAAFAEQVLSPAEREGVLQHLALCAGCREVVVLSLPAVAEVVLTAAKRAGDSVAVGSGRRRDNRKFAWLGLSWGHLRWATLAAGIAVAVFVMRPAIDHLDRQPKPVHSASQPAPAFNGAPPAEVASAAVSENAKAANRGTNVAKDAVEAKDAIHTRDKVAPYSEAMRKKEDLAANSPMARPVLAPHAPLPNGPDLDQMPPAHANETVEVGSGAAATEASGATELVVQSESAELQRAPAIEKAKPPLDDGALNEKGVNQPNSTQKVVAGQLAASPTQLPIQNRNTLAVQAAASPITVTKQGANWAIAKGVLQRSLDGGKTWQTSARTDRLLLCFAPRGQEVWAGGQAGTLMHSFDNGATWSTVVVSFQGRPLTSDLVQIDLPSPTEIVLSTDSHEMWTSADGGKTWEKK